MSLNRFFWPAAACVIAIMGVLEARSALLETQTWDEGIHLSAGYANLTRGDYRWNGEHPPLVKMLCALPLTALGIDLPVNGPGWKKGDEVQLGIDFLYRNRVPADRILVAARGVSILLSVAFAAALAWWTRRRFGAAAGLLAVALCAFDPNLIAHGHYVTTDVPVSALYFFACVLWAEYLENGSRRSLAAAALIFSLAMTAKFSAVLLIPTLAVLYAFRWAQRPSEFPIRRAALAAAALAAALFLVVNLVYWPETWRCVTTHVDRLSNVVDRGNFTGRMLYRAGRWFHLPAHRFLTGLGQVAAHNSEGHASYLLGLRSDKGWWYYFPVVFGVKSTMAALAATALLAFGGARLARKRAGWAERFRSVPIVWAALLFPPAFYFLFSMTSGINIGMRHILPVYPFLYVAAAALLAGWHARRFARYAMLGLGALQIAECASITPDYLAFFNALSGGPGNGPRYLVDSNIDWGQDVKKLVRWLDAHGTRKVSICYFGNAQLRYYGVDEGNLPAAFDQQGWNALDGFVVANVTPLNGAYVPLIDLAPLRLRDPIAKVGWSMYVYDFRKTDGRSSGQR
jgi:hypothetical protein